MNAMLLTIYISVGINAILSVLLILILSKTYAWTEFKQFLKKGVVLILDEKSRRRMIPAKIIQEGFVKTEHDGIFRTSQNSLKYTPKGIMIGFAYKGQVVPSEVAIATQKAEEEKIPAILPEIAEVNGKKFVVPNLEEKTFVENNERKFSYNGLIVSFDAVTKYIGGLNNYLLESLVQREVISALRRRGKLDLKTILIIIGIIILAIVGFMLLQKFMAGKTLTNINPLNAVIPMPNQTLMG